MVSVQNKLLYIAYCTLVSNVLYGTNADPDRGGVTLLNAQSRAVGMRQENPNLLPEPAPASPVPPPKSLLKHHAKEMRPSKPVVFVYTESRGPVLTPIRLGKRYVDPRIITKLGQVKKKEKPKKTTYLPPYIPEIYFIFETYGVARGPKHVVRPKRKKRERIPTRVVYIGNFRCTIVGTDGEIPEDS